MNQDNIQEESDFAQANSTTSAEQALEAKCNDNESAVDSEEGFIPAGGSADNSLSADNSFQPESSSSKQYNNNQVSNLERQLLLNNSNPLNIRSLSNWTKVILTALSVMIPGIGQIIGTIAGLVFVANDRDSDRRLYGAALITVSMIAFVLSAIFWFTFILSFGPELFY
ncbi:hypothetical protein LY28_01234 [Ruminiclostridium sufflavum DSM 19573]|uniref:Uncharacterized protein n=1 Tax=Ruminiclostridium sufflavum DSM 19573 TaxID=1121337 RepID=A0A318XPJ8_9FIRM|nr:hypothetical protein [Ruminiclostridium sufflavum]PYG88870.1 hypothetical protein LY28_01234 [Ruminiclostridium sufflavum DSM 19573]